MIFVCFLFFLAEITFVVFVFFGLINVSSLFVFCTALLLSFLWADYASTTPVSDFLQFYNEAVGFSESPSLMRWEGFKNPISSVYYSFFIFLFGKSYFSASFGASLMWALQSVVVKKILVESRLDASMAGKFAMLYVLCPGVVFFSPVISSEAVFIFLVLISVLLGLKLLRAGNVYLGLFFGFFSGLSFLTRTNAVLFLTPVYFLVALNLLARNVDVGKLRLFCALLIGTAIMPFFQFYVNAEFGSRYSFSPTKWTAYNFLAGTNIDHRGAWNLDDVQLAGYDVAKSNADFENANKKALSVALERVAADPVAFIKFATGDKLFRLWAGDGESIYWSSASKEVGKGVNTFMAERISTAYMHGLILACAVAVVVLFSVSLKRSVWIDEPIVVVSVFSLSLNAVLHFFIEVQGRYHIPFYPFMIFLVAASCSSALKIFLERKPF